MRRHPTAPVNVAGISVATSGTDFTAPDGTYKHGGSSATPPSASLYRERIIYND